MFPEIIDHDSLIRKEDIIGAGFFWFENSVGDDINVVCYGKSVKLGMESKPEDAIEVKATLLGMSKYQLM